MVKNRKYIEDLIYKVFDQLDPSGDNTNKYKVMFSAMDEKEFEKFFKDFLKNDKENFAFDIVDFEHGLDMDLIEKAAKIVGIPLMETVYMKHLTMDKSKAIATKEKCLVGYINVKRTQQFLQKKNGISVSNDKRSATTGQVVDKDKNSRSSDIEASLLVALGANDVLRELHGPRADDVVMKREMMQSISNKGYVLLDELTDLTTNKITLNTINTYLLGMGLKSDLVSDSYILPKLSEELFE